MRDLIASHAPLRTRRHKARPVSCQHYPQGIQGDRNPLGTPFSSIFRRAAKDGVPEGRSEKRMPVKLKASPPLLFSILYYLISAL